MNNTKLIKTGLLAALRLVDAYLWTDSTQELAGINVWVQPE